MGSVKMETSNARRRTSTHHFLDTTVRKRDDTRQQPREKKYNYPVQPIHYTVIRVPNTFNRTQSRLNKSLYWNMKLSTAIAAILPLSAAAFAPASFHATKSKTSLNLRPIASNNESVTSTTTLNALTTTELPDKLYIPQGKEVPKVLGGLKIGTRKLCVVTGASSGLGLNASASLAKTGRHFVVMACRDVEKGKRGEFLFEIDPN
jgi:hypothetical protein